MKGVNCFLRVWTCLVAAVFASVSAGAVQTETVALSVGGTERSFVCCTPDGLEAGRPLMIALHGLTWDADYMRTHFRAETVADTARFCVVYPDGIGNSWDISGTTDTEFICSIIDWAAEHRSIDRSRVYLTGFSMGGMLTYHSMNLIADRIAAFAAMSGYPLINRSYESSRPVPLLHIHGTSDPIVWYSSVPTVIENWVARNGCDSEPVLTSPYKAQNITRYRYLNGTDGVEVELLKMSGVAHKLVNDSIFSAEEVWNFCSRFSLPSEQSAIEETAADEDGHTDYFDLGGRRLASPAGSRGVIIQRVRKADGSVECRKMVVGR